MSATPRDPADIIHDIDVSLTVLTRAQHHHTDPRAEEQIDRLLEARHRIHQEADV